MGPLEIPRGLSLHELRLTVNGSKKEREVECWTKLLDLLRERLQLFGTKKGCDHGQCGACTVLVNGDRVNSCLLLAVTLNGLTLHRPEQVLADVAR
ncbi:2Fe-2S iron-sulfur cluster-binding protein [Luteolibacter arcticus]|uniref:2Fe-2S iron-sulfur cluster-binding protein n=1 Tax=Luteolibacter arcticus TaxID=1581411 RepID=A0ABT3GK98_9BACT|nr:2Fe-2S iron-sulfur cluster-binding protein [Luteolibacter arcticus]MCW1923923.1 2Fe-2S iron-sulfur cluster-binding protein [Luteolibacter arcticus]